jgi:type IV secretory pathway ATPase VirB11/archaellum biosynthesis ATPase
MQTTNNSKTSLIGRAMVQLEPFIGAPNVTEVCFNRFGEVWVETATDGFLPPIAAPEFTEDFFSSFMTVLSNRQGGWFRLENPQVSAELPGGHRFEGILSRSAIKTGILASVRVKRNMGHLNLKDFGFHGIVEKINTDYKTKNFKDIINTIVNGVKSQKYVVLISGCMGSGKTTLYNCLLKNLPKMTRIISIEDTFELNLEDFPNSGSILVDRNDKNKLFDYNNAISSVLRLRPDVIYAGELSIDNTLPILRLLDLGHGFMCTLHASSATAALAQAFQQNIRLLGGNIDGIYEMLKNNVDAVIHAERFGSQRVVTEVLFPKENYLWKNDNIFDSKEILPTVTLESAVGVME